MDVLLRFADIIAAIAIGWNFLVFVATFWAELRYYGDANTISRLFDQAKGVRMVFNWHRPLLYVVISSAWISARHLAI
jgi:hypothetical protein